MQSSERFHLLMVIKGFSLRVKSRLSEACVQTAMLHDSKTSAATADDLQRFERNEADMLRWMYSACVHAWQC